MIEITSLEKTGGPLTKSISLSEAGALLSDGSACVMSKGYAHRVRLAGLGQFAARIGCLGSNEAIALGALRSDLPDTVEITTKRKIADRNAKPGPAAITRTIDHISYTPGVAALVLIDIDTKGMPDPVRARIRALGGFGAALALVIPELATTARVVRSSTSSGLQREDTGETIPGSNGQHIFVLVKEGDDAERFLRTLHDRCWLEGLGWLMVGAGGQMLDRSLIDRTVAAPERIVFEGAPVLAPPVTQDAARRAPIVHEGTALDTRRVCIGLTIAERAKLDQMRRDERRRLSLPARDARQSLHYRPICSRCRTCRVLAGRRQTHG